MFDPGKSSFDFICELAITSVVVAAILFLVGLKADTVQANPPSVLQAVSELLQR